MYQSMKEAINGAYKGIGEPPGWRIVKKKRIINVASGVNTDGLELSHDSENSLRRNESDDRRRNRRGEMKQKQRMKNVTKYVLRKVKARVRVDAQNIW